MKELINKIEKNDSKILTLTSEKMMRSMAKKWRTIDFTDKELKKIRAKIDRIGEKNKNRYGTEMVIVQYLNSNNIAVEFQDEEKYIAWTSYRHFKNKSVQNPYDHSVKNIGFLGVGPYKSFVGDEITREYLTWANMISRCYSDVTRKQSKSYAGCLVAPEWHNFQNFATWYNKNIYKIERDNIEIDKDLLISGNKIYSPDTCCLIPGRINNVISHNCSKNNLPLGVIRKGKKFNASCRTLNGKNIHLGTFNTDSEAFWAYKIFKERLISDVAEEFKKVLPLKVYRALKNYKIQER